MGVLGDDSRPRGDPRLLFRDAFTVAAGPDVNTFDSAEIKGPAIVRWIAVDLSAFLPGGARTVTLFWAGGPVADQNDLDRFALGSLDLVEFRGGRGDAYHLSGRWPVKQRKFIAIRVLSIDPTARRVSWSVTGHD